MRVPDRRQPVLELDVEPAALGRPALGHAVGVGAAGWPGWRGGRAAAGCPRRPAAWCPVYGTLKTPPPSSRQSLRLRIRRVGAVEDHARGRRRPGGSAPWRCPARRVDASGSRCRARTRISSPGLRRGRPRPGASRAARPRCRCSPSLPLVATHQRGAGRRARQLVAGCGSMPVAGAAAVGIVDHRAHLVGGVGLQPQHAAGPARVGDARHRHAGRPGRRARAAATRGVRWRWRWHRRCRSSRAPTAWKVG